MAEEPLIDYATPETAYVDILLATKKGYRKTKVRKTEVGKKYAKTKTKKGETYARKIKVRDELTNRTKTVKLTTGKSKKDFFYDTKTRTYTYYNPERKMDITLTTGQTVSATEEQVRYLFTRHGSKYALKQTSARIPQRTIPVVKNKLGQNSIPRKWQLVVTQKVDITIDGYTRTLSVVGYSKVNNGRYSYDELLEQAYRFMKARIMDEGGKYDYGNVEFKNTAIVTSEKWIYTNLPREYREEQAAVEREETEESEEYEGE